MFGILFFNSNYLFLGIDAKNGTFKDMMSTREVKIRVEMPKF